MSETVHFEFSATLHVIRQRILSHDKHAHGRPGWLPPRSGVSAAAHATMCKEMKFDVTKGLCKGASVNGKRCMGADMTSESLKTVVEMFDADTMCKDPMGVICEAYGGKLKADYCNENGAYCTTQLGDGGCTADEDCTTTKKPCCSLMKSTALDRCSDVDTDKMDTMMLASKASGVCADTDCISGATSLRGGTIFASAASALVALVVATVY